MNNSPPLAPPSSMRLSCAVGALCSVLLLVLYVYTASPTVALGHDTGELVTCATIQGVPHSPGYPLYVAMGWCWNQVFAIGDPCWRMNIFSAFCVALGSGFLAAGLTLPYGPLAGFVGAMLFGTTTFVWRQAVTAEVFGLHLFFLCVLVFLALYWERSLDETRRYILHWTSFILGCCLAHHHTIALAAPAFIAFGVLAKGKGRPWGFHWLNLPTLLTALIAPYYLQMTVARARPAINWADPSTPSAALAHFLRKAYGSFSLNVSSTENDERAGQLQASIFYVSLLRSQFPLPQPLLLLLGMDRALLGGQFARGVLFFGLAITYGPIFALIGNQPAHEFFMDLLERFYSSSMVGWAGLAAMGIASGQAWLRHSRARHLFVAAALAMPLLSISSNWDKCSQRGQYQAYDFVSAQIDMLPKNALYLCLGDLHSGVADYITKVERRRPDLVLILPGLIVSDWYTRNLPEPFRKAADDVNGDHQDKINGMIAYCHSKGIPVVANYYEDRLKGNFINYGMYEQSYADGKAPSTEQMQEKQRQVLRAMLAAPRRGYHRTTWRRNFWHNAFVSDWASAFYEAASSIQAVDPELAYLALDKVLELREDPEPGMWLNHGILALRFKQYRIAERDCKAVLLQEPNNIYAVALLVDIAKAEGNRVNLRYWLNRLRELQRPRAKTLI
jgi:hypothetical protein